MGEMKEDKQQQQLVVMMRQAEKNLGPNGFNNNDNRITQKRLSGQDSFHI